MNQIDEWPALPTLPTRKNLQPVSIGQLEDDMVVEDALWQHGEYIGQQVEDVKWRNSVIYHLNMTESRIKRLSLRAIELDHLVAANTDWSEAILDDVIFRDSKLTGIKLNESRFATVHFIHCKVDFSQFQGIKAKKIVFDHCELANAYFNNADLKVAIFHNCDLSRVDFSQAKLLGADFRGSSIEGIRIDPTKLPKVKVDLAQALHLIQLLGLEIG